MQPANLIRMHSGQVKGMNDARQTQWPSQLENREMKDVEGVARVGRVESDDSIPDKHFSSGGTTLMTAGAMRRGRGLGMGVCSWFYG